jgi:predicted nucleic acid-binding protein
LPGLVATLDACVLFQGWLTDLLLCLAEAKAFEPIWSDEIHAEWMRNLHSRMGIPIEKVEYRRDEMERAFPAANVAATPALVSAIQGLSNTVAQRKDAHVVATAVASKATVIVTHNVRDFAPKVLGHYGLSKIRPGAFCVDLLGNCQAQVLAGIRTHRASLKRTPMSTARYLDYLADDIGSVCRIWRSRWHHARDLFETAPTALWKTR